MVRTSDLVFGCSVVRAYHPYIFRESSVTTFKLFKISVPLDRGGFGG